MRDVVVDVIFRLAGVDVTDALLQRASRGQLFAVTAPLLALEDVLASKLLALDEHEADFEEVLEIARGLREQIEWQQVRGLTCGSPFAQAFFTLVEGLGIVEPPGET